MFVTLYMFIWDFKGRLLGAAIENEENFDNVSQRGSFIFYYKIWIVWLGVVVVVVLILFNVSV